MIARERDARLPTCRWHSVIGDRRVMNRIEAAAERSVARACGFAALGIFCFMIGLSSETLVMALQAGGLLTLVACLVLMLKAWGAQSRPYNRTEVWSMLAPDERPDAAVAQRVIGSILREVYLRFAMHAALLATGFLILSALLSFTAGSLRG